RVDRLEAAVSRVAWRVGGVATAEALPRLERAPLVLKALLLDGRDLIAAFGRDEEERVECGIVGARRPVLAAIVGRAHPPDRFRTGPVSALGVDLHILGGIVVEGLAGLWIEPGRPGHVIDVLLAGHEGTVDAIQRVIEAVPRRMHHELPIL